MAATRKYKSRTNRKDYTESDEDDSATKSADADWSPDQEERDQLQTPASNDTSLPEELEFDSTEGFNLKTIKSVKQSQHIIWNRFGHLMKNGKTVDKVKDRVYCITCFEKKKFKR